MAKKNAAKNVMSLLQLQRMLTQIFMQNLLINQFKHKYLHD